MYKQIQKKLFLVGICVILVQGVFSQQKTTEELLIGQYFDQIQTIKEISKELNILNHILKNKGQQKLLDSVRIQGLQRQNTVPYYLCLGFYNLYNQRSNSKAFVYFNEAYLLSKTNQNSTHLKLSLLGFLELYSREMVQSNTQFKLYLDEFESLSSTIEDEAWVLYYTNFFNSASIFRPEDYYSSSQKLIPFVKRHDLSNAIKIRFHQDIALYYKIVGKPDSARIFYKKVLQSPDATYNRIHKFHSAIHLVELSANDENFEAAKMYINQATKYYDKSDSIRSFFTIDRFKAIYFFEKIPVYDSAYHYLKSSILKEHQIDYEKNSLQISELNVKLRTAEKENEILEQQHKIKEEQQKKNSILMGSIGLILIIAIIAYSTYKNAKKKQFIAEQEKEIEAQKVEKVLKDQELTIINAMIEGQEKERKEVAEELHDSVASTLAAANMQLDYFLKNQDRINDADEILEKAASLVGNAYHDVHDMAHKKNSGVIAQKGLIPAIKDLAQNVSVTNKIQIEVHSSDVEARISNSLEITIFRITQELINNVVKHANASKANISIAFSDHILKLTVKDNGKGFQMNEELMGMGIQSIKKRIQALEGTFEVDSVINRGTNIFIDIPIT